MGAVNPESRGEQVLWALSDGRHVVTSKLLKALDTGQPETYIFECSAEGEIVDFAEMDGSTRGECSHEQAIKNAGWEVAL